MKRRFPIDMYWRNPWPWLRHMVSWRMLDWLGTRYHLCWVHLVNWKLGEPGHWGWAITKHCLHNDYCGFYDTRASREEREEGERIVNEQGTMMVRFK